VQRWSCLAVSIGALVSACTSADPPPPRPAQEIDAGGAADAAFVAPSDARLDAPLDAGSIESDSALGGDDAAPPTSMSCGVAGECDVVAQDCAPENACYVYGASGAPLAPHCAPEGGVGLNAPCTTVNDCAAGYACYGSGGGVMGQCKRYCCRDAPECGAEQVCSRIHSSAPAFGICTGGSDCTLMPAFIGCPTGLSCYVVSGAGSRDCFRTGTLTEGSDCTTLNGCLPGFGCLQPAPTDTARCHKYCDLFDVPSDCPSGQRCVSAGYSTLPSVGFCVPT